MHNIRHQILVLSGKGGVGKSTVSAQLALALVDQGYKVGLLDVDLCGPSIPKILGLSEMSAYNSQNGWVPVYTDDSKQLAVMSLAFLLENKDSPVIWRGPKKHSIIKQFIENVAWGPLDFLVVDTPPGTSDEHISICELLAGYSPDGAIVVTTPQRVSTADVRREITFCQQVNLPLLGIVENMSGFVCPCCQEETKIFSSGGGQALAKHLNLPFLGKIPIEPALSSACDGAKPLKELKSTRAVDVLKKFVADRYPLGLDSASPTTPA
ncbi:cytosolic Fe-S cluster assembly factor NUBP2 homolog [Schistocerca gregaria]|uniref:cytosolic Fe-S cluster assembly factor NUBP2 homolog n=1 Tax=Schistocerca gregaria TaxID=7010 RepID=UPI00211DF648|nr:cytosolic Fe-S cluster assembly factor NUBP2 homolog [Schistocerca gregaria]